MSKTAVVIGGGIVGLCSALALQDRGFRVTVIEADREGRAASWGNAGHVAIEQVEPLASWSMIRSAPRRLFSAGGALALPIRDAPRWLPFAKGMVRAAGRFEAGRAALDSLLARTMPAWRGLVAMLGESALLKETGHFVLWESEASAAAGLKAWGSADIGTARFRPIDEDERAQFETLLARRPAGGIRFENTGQVADLSKLADTLSQALQAARGEIRHARVSALTIEDGSARAILEGDERLDADVMVVAAGARSGELMRSIGTHAPIIAERGYHLHAPSADWPELPPVVFEDRSMIVTRFDNGLRAASFVELGDIDSPPDPRKWKRLRAHIDALGLPIGSDAVKWMGARPTLPDYLPAIGRSERASNLIYAFGHQHLGLTLAPITAQIIGALATNTAAPVALAPYDIERFAKGR
ncbi:NAD(P)/FAD-dependent oxidoreductase [Sphingomonas cavernae]|uniref:FAD-binding oxidoreductase n=1 Tax=Sphingomonas cavernae TaxID=2320861 RepID=A0A418W734_9SPHN|nr:FAD-dependent oxidoreductase [Sphingomonas cavernae]RJF85855.1 FAD-binding oxidoreductase [Sphingomonas cavernae]